MADKYPGLSPYAYVTNNPIRYVDYKGLFPIDPQMRKNYPLVNNFIENQLQGYITNSPRMSGALIRYSGGNLTKSQIAADFASDGGPNITGHTYDTYGGIKSQGGEYDYNTNTIKFSNKELARFEKILGNSDETIQKWGKMDFTALFVHEYVHYGDALDGMDVIMDANGNIVNDPYAQEPSASRTKFLQYINLFFLPDSSFIKQSLYYGITPV